MNFNNEHPDRPRGSAGRKQAIAIAVVLALGAAAAVGILTLGRNAGGESSHAHEEADGHEDGHGHGHGEAKAGHDKTEKNDKADKKTGHAQDGHEKAEAGKAGADQGHDEAGEGVIVLSAEQQQAAGIVVELAKAATLASSYQLPGEVKFNEDTTAHVVPRVAGVVEAVPVSLGQAVRKGQVLAVVSSTVVSDQRADLQSAQKRLQLAKTTYEREQRLYEEKISPQQDVQIAEQAMREAEIAVANARQKLQAVGATLESRALNRFELRAPFDGTIVEKHIALGEQVREDANVFTVADLRTVWAQISVPAKDLPLVRVGDRVTVRATAFDQSAVGQVAYVGSLIGEATRTAQARVTLQNPAATWRPGLFVNVEMKSASFDAPVTVTAEAVQTMADRSVVFVRTEAGFIARPVQVGRSDGQRIEIVGGLRAGEPYIAVGSFLAKAEAGKSTASHAH